MAPPNGPVEGPHHRTAGSGEWPTGGYAGRSEVPQLKIHPRYGLFRHISFCSKAVSCTDSIFLNQARAGHRPACAWFLNIAFVREVSMRVCVWMCVCVSAPEAMNN